MLQNVNATATLTNTLGPLVGFPVNFTYHSSGSSTIVQAGTFNTNASGIAGVTDALNTGEIVIYDASFAGASGELASSGESAITLPLGQDSTNMTIMISPPNPVTGQTIAFSGILTDTTTNTGVGIVPVSVVLDSTNEGIITTATDGSYGGSLTGVANGNHTLTATFSGNSVEKNSSATINFTVSNPIMSGTTGGLNPMLIVGAAAGLGAIAYLALRGK